MRNPENEETASRPRRLLLHVVRKGEEWTGRVKVLDRDQEFNFASLDDLKAWLDQEEGQGC